MNKPIVFDPQVDGLSLANAVYGEYRGGVVDHHLGENDIVDTYRCRLFRINLPPGHLSINQTQCPVGNRDRFIGIVRSVLKYILNREGTIQHEGKEHHGQRQSIPNRDIAPSGWMNTPGNIEAVLHLEGPRNTRKAGLAVVDGLRHWNRQ